MAFNGLAKDQVGLCAATRACKNYFPLYKCRSQGESWRIKIERSPAINWRAQCDCTRGERTKAWNSIRHVMGFVTEYRYLLFKKSRKQANLPALKKETTIDHT